jgi:hypothetical protein
MSIDSSLRAHAVSLAPICFCACFSGLLACGGLADPEGAEADGEATETRVQQLSAGGLSITGSSTLQPLTASDGYANLFDGNFNLTNNTNRTVSINKQLFFFAAPGGYAYADPSFDIWWSSLPAGATAQVGGLGWIWSATVAHLVTRVDGTTSSGTPVAALAGIPVIAPGRPSPGPSPYIDDINIGVQEPIEILNLTSGERWLPITGTVVDTTVTASAPPTLTIRARSSVGNTVATLAQGFGDDSGMPVIRTFLAWTALAQNASVANVRITATQPILGGTASQTRTIPVVNASPVSIVSPVSGEWAWSNGPGDTFWDVHTNAPEARYAYDLGVQRLVNGQLQTFSGDPNVNSSFFCWDQPIRAALTGTVVSVQDSLPDNNGWLFDNNQGNNEIILEHPNKLFTRYAHMRQGTATVTLGQKVWAGSVIALVGNAGASSEPHLHFHAFRIDSTGRQVAVPVTVPGMRSASGVAVTGVPRGGLIHQAP